MDLSLKWAYLKQVILKNLPLSIAVLLLFVSWSNYAYHGWKGLIGPLLLTIAMVAFAVRQIEQGDERNKLIQKRLYEETVRANQLDLEVHVLQNQVDALSRPPTSHDVIGAAELIISAGMAEVAPLRYAGGIDMQPQQADEMVKARAVVSINGEVNVTGDLTIDTDRLKSIVADPRFA